MKALETCREYLGALEKKRSAWKNLSKKQRRELYIGGEMMGEGHLYIGGVLMDLSTKGAKNLKRKSHISI